MSVIENLSPYMNMIIASLITLTISYLFSKIFLIFRYKPIQILFQNNNRGGIKCIIRNISNDSVFIDAILIHRTDKIFYKIDGSLKAKYEMDNGIILSGGRTEIIDLPSIFISYLFEDTLNKSNLYNFKLNCMSYKLQLNTSGGQISTDWFKLYKKNSYCKIQLYYPYKDDVIYSTKSKRKNNNLYNSYSSCLLFGFIFIFILDIYDIGGEMEVLCKYIILILIWFIIFTISLFIASNGFKTRFRTICFSIFSSMITALFVSICIGDEYIFIFIFFSIMLILYYSAIFYSLAGWNLSERYGFDQLKKDIRNFKNIYFKSKNS